MNISPLYRRPLGCLKANLRQARQRRQLFRRTLATTTEPTNNLTTPDTTNILPDHSFYTIDDRKSNKLRTAFAVYNNSNNSSTTNDPSSSPSRPVLAPTHPDPLPALRAAQIARQDPTGARTAMFDRSNRNCARPGDVLMVTHRRGGEPFAGVLISLKRAGIDTAILLRGQLTKVGVEMWFKVYNKNVAGIEIVRRRPKRARRARLTYMRKPKHDMGNVDHFVLAWRRSRNIMTTKKAPAKNAKAKAKK